MDVKEAPEPCFPHLQGKGSREKQMMCLKVMWWTQNHDARSAQAVSFQQTNVSLPFLLQVPHKPCLVLSPAAFSVGCAPGNSTSLHNLTTSPNLISLNVSRYSGEQDLVFLALVLQSAEQIPSDRLSIVSIIKNFPKLQRKPTKY